MAHLPGFDVEPFLAEVRPRLGEEIEITIEHTRTAGSLSRDARCQTDRAADGFRAESRRDRRSLYDGRRDPMQALCQTRHTVRWALRAQAAAGTPFDGAGVQATTSGSTSTRLRLVIQVLYETVCEFCRAALSQTPGHIHGLAAAGRNSVYNRL